MSSHTGLLTTTPRLNLSYLESGNDTHCDFIVTLFNTPEFIASNGGNATSIVTREAARQYTEKRFEGEYVRNGFGSYLLSLRRPSPTSEERDGKEEVEEEVYIGTISLNRGPPTPENPTVPDLGFAILPAFMRQGFAIEASRGMLEYAERELGIKEVVGLCAVGNRASNGVFEKLGWRDRGTWKLKGFGGEKGERSRVWVREGMEGGLEGWGLVVVGEEE
ncbi:unnamed protein product [Zymoseptoria tritici ST99CH_1E4]|uniref:N-acetyltransferase domain-containing protein n=1 Tax=Zymoseptoria tritici ST99CH_1E4 TaxID=1276532 RepID=A0A2H1GMJ4_ZYMTR|nr:unnamed protein product [Zymoseptoria tritici ST99CH_1E4]